MFFRQTPSHFEKALRNKSFRMRRVYRHSRLLTDVKMIPASINKAKEEVKEPLL